MAVAVGAVAWFQLLYLFFGFTGKDSPAAFSLLAALITFGPAFGFSLLGATRPAEVVRRSCRLGLFVSLLLPVTAIAVLLLWENASDRPDLGMGGLMLYGMPVAAFGAAAVLGLIFGVGGRLASRRLRNSADSEAIHSTRTGAAELQANRPAGSDRSSEET